ncbi:hypothetical protein QT970_25530 [Microcoleus sp. herbarium8]
MNAMQVDRVRKFPERKFARQINNLGEARCAPRHQAFLTAD